MNQLEATVISNKRILEGFSHHGRTIKGSWLIWLKCPEIVREAKPGQFVMVRCGGESVLPRPFSIHQVKGNSLAILYAVLESGKGTNWLSQRREGESITLIGPMGNGFMIEPAAKNLLLVAGGIGIAPLRFLQDKAISQGCSVQLLEGVATDSQLYDALVLPNTAKPIAATEDGSAGTKGMITSLLPQFIDRFDQVFACGPVAMYRDMYARRDTLLKGKPTQVSMEIMMGCGRGVCYGCTIKTKNGLKEVCTDGPVFDLNDILWDELR